MKNTKKTIVLDKIDTEGKVIRIKFLKQVTPKSATAYITAALNKCFKHSFYQIVIDMENVSSPSDRFIGTLIEATAKIRRKDGDIKLINLSEEVKQAFSAFNAYSFLSIESEK